MNDQKAKELICEIGKRMYDRNFVAANDGNISMRNDDGNIWCTPTGVSKGFMQPDMMVKVNIDGTVIEGDYQVSSELKMHLKVYQDNQDVQAIVHAHPIGATSFALARQTLNLAYLPEAIVNLGVVPVADYATPGSKEMQSVIAPYTKDYNALLLANHGALTWGLDLMDAYYRMESLEHYAQILLNSTKISSEYQLLSNEEVSELIDIRTKLKIKRGMIPNGK